MTVSRVAAVNMPPTDSPVAAVKVWGERKVLPGSTVAQVEAYVVPASGVGWVDCEWRSLTVPNSRRHVKMSPEHRRLLADWTGGDQSSVVRQVIQVADGWFAHCAELAEREVAAAALAEDPDKTPLPVGPIGATGPSPPNPSPPNMQQIKRQIEEMQKTRAFGGGPLSPSPYARENAVQGVLVPLAEEEVFGMPERRSEE